MGLCSSKADRPSPTTIQTTTTHRTAPPPRPKSKQKPTQKSQIKSKQKRPQKTKNKSNASAKRGNGSNNAATLNTKGHTIADVVDENRQKLSPQEAARLAAEKRFQETSKKTTRGELGRKLAQERAKTAKTHVLEEADQRQHERDNAELVYD